MLAGPNSVIDGFHGGHVENNEIFILRELNSIFMQTISIASDSQHEKYKC